MKYSKVLITVIAISAITLGGCASKEAATEAEASAISVEAVTADKGTVETNYVYSGKTAPSKEAMVNSTVSGIVKKVNFEVGDMVKQGDVLFEMDTEAIQTNLKGLEASYAASQANINASQATLESVNGAQMQIQIENARITCENAKTAYENAKVMYDQGFVSQDDMKKAEDGYNQAKQVYDLTSTTLIEENTKKAQAGLEAAKAQSNATAAQIEAAKKTIRDSRVTSPINGVVTGKNAMAGVMLSNSTTPFTISDTSAVVVKVSVSEQIINSLSKGQLVNIKISAVSDAKVEGKIKTINPAANESGTYDVEIEIANTSGVIKSGMFAEVSFNREKGYNAIVLSRDAVISKNNENYVFVEKDGVAVKSKVVMGVDDGETVQILKGIEKSDKVVVKGQSYLSDGDKIRIVALDGVKIDNGAKTDAAAKPEAVTKTDAPEKKGE